ncbi:MAG: metallophosphoesterase [Candidatus Hodarchaeales archaeon]|jgi:Icc-related predicted phosphoesterase
MKVVVISDVHGRTDQLEGLLKLIKDNNVNIVLFTGDMVKGKVRGDEWLAAQAEGRKPVKSEQIADEINEENKILVNFYRWFDTHKLHIGIVPGNMDAPISRYYKIINYKLGFSNYLHQIHEGFWPYEGTYCFVGFGGVLDSKEEYFVFQPTPEDLEAVYVPENEGKLVFLFHQPPTGGIGKIDDKDIGHPAINRMIEKYNPEFVFVGHTHVQGSQKIGDTIVINPGAFKNGQAAIVDLESKQYDFKQF